MTPQGARMVAERRTREHRAGQGRAQAKGEQGMSDPQDHEVIHAMRVFGGGFVHALAEAAARADERNLALIKATFSAIWAKYTEIAASR